MIGTILLCAAITFGLRALPFFIFRGERTMPQWLERLGTELPPMMMAVLVVYCLKDGLTSPLRPGIAQAAGVAATALVYKWKHQTLLGIAAGTVVYLSLYPICP